MPILTGIGRRLIAGPSARKCPRSRSRSARTSLRPCQGARARSCRGKSAPSEVGRLCGDVRRARETLGREDVGATLAAAAHEIGHAASERRRASSLTSPLRGGKT